MSCNIYNFRFSRCKTVATDVIDKILKTDLQLSCGMIYCENVENGR